MPALRRSTAERKIRCDDVALRRDGMDTILSKLSVKAALVTMAGDAKLAIPTPKGLAAGNIINIMASSHFPLSYPLWIALWRGPADHRETKKRRVSLERIG